MKKAIILILATILFIMAGTSVFASGVYISTRNDDQVRLFESINVDRVVNGEIVTVLGNVNVNSKVNGVVIAVFGDVTVNSEVAGQVVTIFGNTKLTKNAVIQGNLITLGSVQKESGAKVLGNEARIFGEIINVDIEDMLYLRLILMILFTLTVLVMGLLIITLSRDKLKRITENIEYKTDKKLILGFLSILGASIILILLFITVVIPVLYFILMVFSTAVASLYFGRLLLKTLHPARNIYLEFITGLITITLVKLLLIYLLPQSEIVLSQVLLGVFGVFINSIGLGVLMEAKFGKE